MKLKRIQLKNIRSYQNQLIEFPEGSILLSGDIGSGKTSILLGIEFALFGLQPGQRGSSLLKNGENQGGVLIEFEVDDKEIIIERNLKRAKGITQDYCAITIDGDKSETSVTELKDKVLELLNYPREFAKKQNLLYKFTVYTPQEEMKQIILQDSETRINTLRHVFGIDKYKTILENVSILTSKLREEKRIKQALTENLEQDKLDIIAKEDELESKHYNLVSVEKELFLKTENRKRAQEEKDMISSKIEEKKKIEQEIEKSQIRMLNKKETLSSNFKLLESLDLQIRELEALKFDESKILNLEEQIETLKKQKKEFNEKNLEVTSKITSLSLKNQENESLKSNLSKMEICPTCLQDVESNYKANVTNKIDSNIFQNVKEIENLALEKMQISEKFSKLEYNISLIEKEIQDLKILRVRVEESDNKKERAGEIKKVNELLEKDVSLLQEQITILKNSVFDLSKYNNIYEEKQRLLDQATREERIVDIKVAELKKEIEVFTFQIEELKLKVEKTNKVKQDLDYVIKLEDWLSKKFSPVISFIEKNVMVKLKAEFSKLFAQWFSMLVSDNFNVKLRDDFTPVVEYQDYEIDYAYLSGGERTAIALAYRLSLNQVINSLLSKIKTRDLVILDEPTDGFSDAQLDKMREVLEELNVAQLIIVSHEQKIEGFVENVIRFKKEGGISKKVG
ncbi:MAG: AAA family ATPase [archaeon]